MAQSPFPTVLSMVMTARDIPPSFMYVGRFVCLYNAYGIICRFEFHGSPLAEVTCHLYNYCVSRGIIPSSVHQ
jgi:hypothetical protein